MPIPIQNQETKPKKLISLFIKCVIMALFLSLFLIFLLFLGFAALVLLHFLITSTAFHRRHRRRHHHRFPANQTSSFDLPCVSYCVSQQSVRDCAICLEGFKDGEFCRKLPDCGHLFHVKCVDSWLMRVLNCPICRTRVRVDSGNSGSVISDEDWKRWWAVGVSGN
ncbi:RING-H2 finger protein ATL56-like [Solanum stenotomum]|nr:RING-H2 finger protein ATL56-like [Solanum stenotomum]